MAQALEIPFLPSAPAPVRDPGQAVPRVPAGGTVPLGEGPPEAAPDPFDAVMQRLLCHARQNMQGRPPAGQ